MTPQEIENELQMLAATLGSLADMARRLKDRTDHQAAWMEQYCERLTRVEETFQLFVSLVQTQNRQPNQSKVEQIRAGVRADALIDARMVTDRQPAELSS
jgi:hypothetical protein